jgi:chromosome segregation ATPase
MTEIVTEERSWTCACTSEHRPTISRAWCFDCSEWCYPTALCVRGEAEQTRAELEGMVGNRNRLLDDKARLTIEAEQLRKDTEWMKTQVREAEAEASKLREQVKYAQGGQYVAVMQENERLTERVADLESGRVYAELQDRINRLRRIEEAAKWIDSTPGGIDELRPALVALRTALKAAS